MSEAKMLEVAMQATQNQKEQSQYWNELTAWTEEIKKKEEALKEQKPDGNASLPAVRNSLDKKRTKRKKKVKTDQPEPKPSAQKIRSYDYRSWDKFDVDKALEDVDGEKSESEYETDEEWEIERKQKKAIVFKDQGNQYFKEGKYAEAVECYTQGISCDPQNAVLPANRAMALVKQEKYGAAELDCSQAIFLDPSYLKAYHRRGTARAALGKYTEAKEDFMAVLAKEKNNKQAKAELDKVDKILNPPEIMKSLSIEASDSAIVRPIYKPPTQRSKKPLRRIQIEEIGLETHQIKIPESSETKKKLEAQEKAAFDQQFVKKKAASKSTANHDAVSNNLENKLSEIIHKVTTTSVSEDTHQEDSVKLDLSEMETESKRDSKKSSANSPQTSPRVPPVPTTSYQFQRDFKELKNRASDFHQYLKAIPHKQFPKLLGNSLEADVLMRILNTLQEYYVPSNEEVFSVLDALSRVERFDMTVMFMSKDQKKVMSNLLSYAMQQKQAPQDKLSALAKKYGVTDL